MTSRKYSNNLVLQNVFLNENDFLAHFHKYFPKYIMYSSPTYYTVNFASCVVAMQLTEIIGHIGLKKVPRRSVSSL